MPSISILRTSKWLLLAALIILAAIGAAYISRTDALLWYLWHTHNNQSEPAGSAFNLENYRVQIDGRPISDLTDVSGLTYNADTNTLYTVLNQEPYIVEFSLDGRVLRKVRVAGVYDMEGISHVSKNQFVIADEGDNRLISIHLKDGQTFIDVAKHPQMTFGVDAPGNKNFEGISWDGANNRILVVKEKNPKRLLEVRGFIDADASQPSNLSITNMTKPHSPIELLRDFSSVTYHDETGHMLLLSDESRMIKEYDANGRAISALALWRGFHGLKEHVPQAEGIAVGADRRVYVISEPNLLYVFEPPASLAMN